MGGRLAATKWSVLAWRLKCVEVMMLWALRGFVKGVNVRISGIIVVHRIIGLPSKKDGGGEADCITSGEALFLIMWLYRDMNWCSPSRERLRKGMTWGKQSSERVITTMEIRYGYARSSSERGSLCL